MTVATRYHTPDAMVLRSTSFTGSLTRIASSLIFQIDEVGASRSRCLKGAGASSTFRLAAAASELNPCYACDPAGGLRKARP